MNIGDTMEVGGVVCRVEQTLWKTKGSKGQRMVGSETDKNVDRRKRYYVVVGEGGERYWVKERVHPWCEDCWGKIEDEFYRLQKVQGVSVVEQGVSVRAVRSVAWGENRVMVEYLGQGWGKGKDSLLPIVRKWLKVAGMKDYDCCKNNVMMRGSEVVLVDFELGDGKERFRV